MWAGLQALTDDDRGEQGTYLQVYPDGQNLIISIMTNKTKTKAEPMADNTLCTKEVLTSQEAANYMGVSMSYLYKLTMKREIPHYKPCGKMCYFNRVELEAWLQRNRVATNEELNQKAQTYCATK